MSPQPTPAQAAYVAGIIDGEGHISLSRDKARYRLRLAVKSTCEELATWLATVANVGTVRVYRDKRQTKVGTRQVIHEWRVFTQQARVVLELVLPHLIVKREQARLAIEYQGLTPGDRLALGKEYFDRLKWHNGRQTQLRAAGEAPADP
jgi:hypothetical protein